MMDENRFVESLTEKEKESFRDYPVRFIRGLLQESDNYPYSVNGVAVNCSASALFTDDYLIIRGYGDETEVYS
jgi:hypothetical protein